jgi:hypothetical protein
MSDFNITKQNLPEDEYFKNETKKTILVLHHTAGGHRPDWTISGWDKDKTSKNESIRIATSYVIGGKSLRDGNQDFDGKIYEAFEDKYWAHHIGMKTSNNANVNKHSIGIEVCNYGPLTLTKDGKFLTYVNSVVPQSEVLDLGKPFRGYRYWHNYTQNQLESLEFLIKDIIQRHGINKELGLKEALNKKKNLSSMTVRQKQEFLNNRGYVGMDGKKLSTDGVMGGNTKYAERMYNDTKRGDINGFEFNDLAVLGGHGIWSHTSYRKDKSDMYPHPKLIEILKNL